MFFHSITGVPVIGSESNLSRAKLKDPNPPLVPRVTLDINTLYRFEPISPSSRQCNLNNFLQSLDDNPVRSNLLLFKAWETTHGDLAVLNLELNLHS